jgi:G3E family GTPase
VIHVIDVENWAGYSDTSYTAKIQARYTDLIVFNKWEVAGEQRMEVCLDRVGDLEESIAWVKSDRGRVPVSIILIYFCCFFLRELRARKLHRSRHIQLSWANAWFLNSWVLSWSSAKTHIDLIPGRCGVWC